MAPGVMCFGRKPVDPEFRRTEEIDRQLRTDKRRQDKEVKLLLLGTLNPCTKPQIRGPR